jgi:hypothetical protein
MTVMQEAELTETERLRAREIRKTASAVMAQFTMDASNLLMATSAIAICQDTGVSSSCQHDWIHDWILEARKAHPEIVSLLEGKDAETQECRQLIDNILEITAPPSKPQPALPATRPEEKSRRKLTKVFRRNKKKIAQTNGLNPGVPLEGGAVLGGVTDVGGVSDVAGQLIITTPKDVKNSYGQNELMTAEAAKEYIKVRLEAIGAYNRHGWCLPTALQMQEIVRHKDEGALATTIDTTNPKKDYIELNNLRDMVGFYLTSDTDPNDAGLVLAVRADDGEILALSPDVAMSLRPICTEAPGTKPKVASVPRVPAAGKGLALTDTDGMQDNTFFNIFTNDVLTHEEKVEAVARELPFSGKLKDIKRMKRLPEFQLFAEYFVSRNQRLVEDINALEEVDCSNPPEFYKSITEKLTSFVDTIGQVAQGGDLRLPVDFAQGFVDDQKASRDKAGAALTETQGQVEHLEFALQGMQEILSVMIDIFGRRSGLRGQSLKMGFDVDLESYLEEISTLNTEFSSRLQKAKSANDEQTGQLQRSQELHTTMVCAAYHMMTTAAEELSRVCAPAAQGAIAPARTRAIAAGPGM